MPLLTHMGNGVTITVLLKQYRENEHLCYARIKQPKDPVYQREKQSD